MAAQCALLGEVASRARARVIDSEQLIADRPLEIADCAAQTARSILRGAHRPPGGAREFVD